MCGGCEEQGWWEARQRVSGLIDLLKRKGRANSNAIKSDLWVARHSAKQAGCRRSTLESQITAVPAMFLRETLQDLRTETGENG